MYTNIRGIFYMRTYKKLFIVIAVLVFCISFCGCAKNTDDGLLRLHIRANSNNAADQAVKLKVRDEVVRYLDKELGGIDDLEVAISELNKRTGRIKEIADSVLTQNGFYYGADAHVVNEYFPTRMYEELIVESGYYDALIITLGAGAGDNWWCVIYPPLCYLEVTESNKVKYKSKIKELIDKYF